MRLVDKDKFIKALDFLIYELHYPYDPPPFNDWTEEQKKTADWFIMHIRNMIEHAQETKAIPIEWVKQWSANLTIGDVESDRTVIEEMLNDWEKEDG